MPKVNGPKRPNQSKPEEQHPQLQQPSQADQTATADSAFQQTAVSVSNAVTPFINTPTPVVTDVPITPKPTFVTFTDGNYQVGSDIQPGTYRTRTGSPGCYYERLKGFSGTLGDILANNNTDNAAIVTIYASDKGFESNNCGTWIRI